MAREMAMWLKPRDIWAFPGTRTDQHNQRFAVERNGVQASRAGPHLALSIGQSNSGVAQVWTHATTT